MIDRLTAVKLKAAATIEARRLEATSFSDGPFVSGVDRRSERAGNSRDRISAVARLPKTR
jgi:hypothetical protein